ncbi:hypothetical protein RclHR1_04120001 [Rhizophagus clarus]|uniref:Uncharacterized protein n=1 Tax=Rhizophagus clarus TaxID=94130 RepID=A0A2Z6RH30_9GLOM|nr:hypothetical protein RclHR1_04120001 [Rhizophagus clarus]
MNQKCHPTGNNNHNNDGGHYPEVTGASFKSGVLTLTHPQFVNGHVCDKQGPDEQNPYTSYWTFDASQTPSNTWFDVWVSVYTDCNEAFFGGGGVSCRSYDLHYRGWQGPI